MGDNNKEIHTEQSDCIAQKTGDLEVCCKVESSILNYAKKHPEYFIKMLSQRHPLSKDLLTKYSDNWRWSKDGLSRNTSITWSVELIEAFERKLDLEKLPLVILSEDLLEKYNHKLDWSRVSQKYIFPNHGSMALIEKYINKWDWYWLSRNKSIPWSIELIDEFKDRWDYGDKELLFLSIPLPWPWSIELIDKFKDKWNWESLSFYDTIPWSAELIEKFKDKWPRKALSLKQPLTWPVESIKQCDSKWDWESLSPPKTPWSIDLLERNEDKQDWYALSRSSSLPWSMRLIERFEDKWSWGSLSKNENIPWSAELIEAFEDKWYWENLSSNNSFTWSMGLLEKYERYEKFITLYSQENIYNKAFKPYLTETLIDEIMSTITTAPTEIPIDAELTEKNVSKTTMPSRIVLAKLSKLRSTKIGLSGILRKG